MARSSPSVTHICRRPFPGHFSIERLFGNIRSGLVPLGLEPQVAIAPQLSKGLLPRWQNVRWAKGLQSDVFHVTGDIHYVAMGLPTERTILTIHDLEMLTRTSGIKRALLKRYWFDLPLKCVAAVTVISEATKKELLDFTSIDPAIVRVIPNAVDSRFEKTAAPAWSDCPEMLLLGTKANKNLCRTIEACSTLDLRLNVVGKLESEHYELLQRHQSRFVNYVNLSDEDLMALYHRCHLVCFASTSEGFGLPILESNAIGRPVVTSNCSSMVEVAANAARLVDPHSIESIRDGVRDVLENPSLRNQLTQNGFENVKRFELSRVATMYADLYRDTAVAS